MLLFTQCVFTELSNLHVSHRSVVCILTLLIEGLMKLVKSSVQNTLIITSGRKHLASTAIPEFSNITNVVKEARR